MGKTSNEEKPSSAIDSFSVCNDAFYPNIKTLLRILTTLPVSTATAERTFSSLKRIKSYVRNSTSEMRLNGLALHSIHKDVSLDS